jgi:peptidoglycan hydrolase-like protein with peptidoglycan-binding domain
MLVLKVSLLQYVRCNTRIITLIVYWQPKILKVKQLTETWTQGEYPDSDQEISPCYRDTLKYNDFIICVPSWYKYQSNLINLRIAELISQEPQMIDIPVFICECNHHEHKLDENQEQFKQELIKLGQYSNKFSDLFSHNIEYNIFFDDLNQAFFPTIIQYVLIVKTQTLLTKQKCYGGTIDGIFGDRTMLALRRFQKLHDLTANGVLNQKTWQYLKTKI